MMFRSSEKKTRGVAPDRYGFPGFPQQPNAEYTQAEDKEELEKSLLELRISKTKAKLDLIELEEARVQAKLDRSHGSGAGRKTTKKSLGFIMLDSDDSDENKDEGKPGVPLAHSTPVKRERKVKVEDVPQLSRIESGHYGATHNQQHVSDMRMFMARQTMSKDVQYFEGKCEEWAMWYNWWRSTDEACDFAPEEKLLRLQKCLKGEARETVLFLLHDCRNVDFVIDTLKRRYGRPEFMIMSMLQKVEALPPLKEDKAESVMKFATTVTNLVASLDMMGSRNYIDNPQIIREVVNKLPTAMKIRWSEDSVYEPHVTLHTLSRWLNMRAEAAANRMIFSGERPGGSEQPSEKKSLDKKAPEKKPFEKKQKVYATAEVEKKGCSVCDSTEHCAQDCPHLTEVPLQQRHKIAVNKGLCFSCLKKYHSARDCRKRTRCTIDNCGRKHHELLHRERAPDANDPEDPIPRREVVNVNTTMHSSPTNTTTLMKILPVFVTGPKGTIKTYAFLDEGSTITLMKGSLATRLGVSGPIRSLVYQGATPSMQTDDASQTVEVKVKGTYLKAKEYTLRNVRTVTQMSLPRQTMDVRALSQDWRYLSQRPVESLMDAEPEILVGLDNVALITSRETIHGDWNAPYLARTWLGWVVMGKTSTAAGKIEYSCSIVERSDDLYEMVKRAFSTEDFGVKYTVDRAVSREDKRSLKIMEETTQRTEDGRFETGLLWRNGQPPDVPRSRPSAMKRLVGTERRLDRDPELAQVYCAKMDEHIEKGYLKELTPEDKMVPEKNVWYLPHFPVFHPAKKKLRIVFDCAAKSNDVSLNDMLVKGPDLLKPLPVILMNFRRGIYAFMGDIREMFHRVYVRPEDQNYQRILYRGMDRQVDPQEFKLTVLTFGSSCSPTLAGYVKEVNALELKDEYPTAVDEIVNHTYCDDYLGTCDSLQDSQRLVKEIIKVHSAAGFEIVNWCANDLKVLENLPPNYLSKVATEASFTDEQTERALGLLWRPYDDMFTFSSQLPRVAPEILSCERIPTWRQVLKVVMSVYDPLGYISMYTVKGRILLQEIQQSKIDWDTEIRPQSIPAWQQFLRELKDIETVRVPRCYSPNLSKDNMVELHIFGDASERAFAAVAYLRVIHEDGVDVSFVYARSRVAPTKHLSIPRLELQAAVLCTRIGKLLKDNLEVPMDRIVYWTDSMTVLHWIRSDSRRFQQWVGSRLAEIEDDSDVKAWRWVPSKQNAADLATRPKPCDFSQESPWFCGPSFLKLDEREWPSEVGQKLPTDTSEEVQIVTATRRTLRVPLPDVHRFSRWWRLLRATARFRNIALFWLQKARDSIRGQKVERVLPHVTMDDITWAETAWFKEIQREYNVVPLTDKKSKVYELSPFIDDCGVVRMRSRLTQSDYPGKLPIILPPKHPATRLMILDAHIQHLHQGREQVLNYLRQRFYIPQMRAAVKRAWSDCQTCRNTRACVRVPEMAPLPAVRVSGYCHVFTNTGMDYFGPFSVAVGRRREKRWGVIFTCLASRAVHLEVAASLTTDSAIMAIRRFLSRRGPIRRIYCDNGTNLRGASVELKAAVRAIDDDRIREEMLRKMIEFHFIPPAAPHMGGSWERLIGSVKRNLDVVLKEQSPSDEVLYTLFVEIESILNNRPLTHVSIDPNDETALTPNHLIHGLAYQANQPGTFSDDDLLRRSWRKTQRLADKFWQRWSKEYLPNLAKRSKWHDHNEAIKEGDVVVVVDEHRCRGQWPLGIIKEVKPGADGKIRTVIVKTAKGEYCRPVTKIVPLDVGASGTDGENVDV